jgi:beta-lactamase superfamily II metal-dependent hydrolase
MRRIQFVLLAIIFCLCAFPLPVMAQQLSIYAIDTEGGKATLIVTPDKESLLVDAGWPFDARDADRIAAAAKDAGINKIDYLLITHYHIDHVGGVPWLLQKLPVAQFIDHGPTTEHDNQGEQLFAAYERAIARFPRKIAKPGDTIPLKGVEIEVVSSGGELLKQNAVSAGAENPLCAGAVTKPAEHDENEQSVGYVLTFGKFRMVDLVDLTWERERELMCPANLLGKADLFMVSHHGLDRSNSPLLIDSLRPRVAIMNNGALKGGAASVWQTLHVSPGFKGLWQLHTIRGTQNAPEKFVANPEEKCQGYGIKVTATPDGAFKATNLRNGYSVAYPAK